MSACSQFNPLIHGIVGAASRTKDHNRQMALLNQAKTLAESMLEMLYAAKRSGGNPEVLLVAMSYMCMYVSNLS